MLSQNLVALALIGSEIETFIQTHRQTDEQSGRRWDRLRNVELYSYIYLEFYVNSELCALVYSTLFYVIPSFFQFHFPHLQSIQHSSGCPRLGLCCCPPTEPKQATIDDLAIGLLGPFVCCVCLLCMCVCCVCCLFALTFCHLICCCRCRLVSCLVRTAPTGLPLLDLTRTWTGTGTGSATVSLVPFQAAGKSGYRVRRELGIGYRVLLLLLLLVGNCSWGAAEMLLQFVATIADRAILIGLNGN